MARFQVTPPEQFDFKKPADLEKWFVRFDRFKTASGLSENLKNSKLTHWFIVWGKKQMMF